MLEFKDIYSNSSALKSRSTVNNNLSTYDLDEWLINLLPPLSGKEILDLGCGTGNNLIFLKEYGFKKIHGVEGSKTACNLAKNFTKKDKKVKETSADTEKLKSYYENFTISSKNNEGIFEVQKVIYNLL